MVYTSSDTLEPGFILPHPKGYICLGLAWSGMRCSSSNLFDPVGVLTVRRSSVFCSLFSLLISVFYSCNPSLFGSWFFSRPRKDQFLLIGVSSWAPHCSSSVIHSSQSSPELTIVWAVYLLKCKVLFWRWEEQQPL